MLPLITVTSSGLLILLSASTGFLLVLLFDPEDGGSMFIWIVSLCLNYTVLQQRFVVTSVRSSNPINTIAVLMFTSKWMRKLSNKDRVEMNPCLFCSVLLYWYYPSPLTMHYLIPVPVVFSLVSTGRAQHSYQGFRNNIGIHNGQVNKQLVNTF